ncbi:hypothetical protein SO802_030577 [Lithocarpus litseifolius]|uniref:Uncharacterized protein n=1 Tax=Lithocarpus litseifolius TaxID=425828 RepID=A0AAW2BI49_9ROSI
MESDYEPHLSTKDDYHKKCEAMVELESGKFGCSHYRRRCKIRAPCCDEIFDCRHCHNESKNSLEVDPVDRHDVPRHDLKRVICSMCSTEQDIQQNCIQCGVCMGKYFCSKCNFFDDDVSKKQYHCDECGICRTGGKENFFHCSKYGKVLNSLFIVLETVSFVFLFDTTKEITVLRCGHTIHLECVREMEHHFQYSCPICSKFYCDMSRVWEKLDEEVAATPMPQTYQNKMVWILCNDCGKTSEVNFHIVAHKCLKCKSYNTRQTQGGPISYPSRIAERDYQDSEMTDTGTTECYSNNTMASLDDMWSQFTLSEEEVHEADVPSNKESSIHRLVGKFLTKRIINAKAVARTFKPMWKPVGELKIWDVDGNILVFEFDEALDLERVLEFEPWSYDKSLLIFQKTENVEAAPSLDYAMTSFGVQLHNVPEKSLTQETGEAVGNIIGTTIKVADSEDNGAGCEFLLDRVSLNITKPHPRCCKLKCEVVVIAGIARGPSMWKKGPSVPKEQAFDLSVVRPASPDIHSTSVMDFDPPLEQLFFASTSSNIHLAPS